MSGPRAVLITGAARGLGKAISLHLAAPGTRLLLHHHQSVREAEETAAQARERGSEVSLHRADLSRPAEREALMDDVASQCGALHLLINNAGRYEETGLLETTPEQWERMLQINCSAVFHLIQRALPLLEAGAEGAAESPARVINLGDSGAERIVARPQATPYHVAKLGVHVLTRSFAKALAGRAITVNMISPGFLENSAGEPGSPLPMGREGTFADILGALDYLVSQEAAYVTGANLIVAGGWNL